MNATSCPLSGGRTLRSALLNARHGSDDCARPVFHDVASANLGVVVTFSAGSLAAQRGFNELRALQTMLIAHAGVARAVLVGKGSRCFSTSKSPLHDWALQGKAHCIQGPNVGAREAHTIWAFMHDFYHHLPRVSLFVQDDPSLFHIRKELVAVRLSSMSWAKALEDSFAARAQLKGAPSSSSSWVPTACACSPVREAFSAASYGGYRPMHWWMRSFLLPYANSSLAPLPDRIAWPSTAQFALPRSAIRARSRAFIHLNVRLTEVPAPLKSNVPRRQAEGEELHKRTAKWANFGPAVIDLGDAPPRGRGYADVRPWINGMDFAQLYERSWFQAFDPATPEALPPFLECYSPAAIAKSPIRCAGAACPYRNPAAATNPAGGCAASDAAGRTQPPKDWPYALSPERRCLGAGCLVGREEGSGAWAMTRRRRRR